MLNKLNLHDLGFFHSNSYEHYHKTKLKKEIVVNIPDLENEMEYFWRAVLKKEVLKRTTIEIFFPSNKDRNISEKQIKLFEKFTLNLEKITSLLEEKSKPYIKSLSLNDILTSLSITLLQENKVKVELWTLLDQEHPLFENEIFSLDPKSIASWEKINDATALLLLKEIIEHLDNDTILKKNSEALEKKYSKTNGWLLDLIFNSEELNPENLLMKLKEDDIIYL